MFPSEPGKKSGRFVGFADNVRNALTFAILTDDTKKIIYRSEVRTAEDPKSLNLQCYDWGDDATIESGDNEIIKSRNEGSSKPHMAFIDVEDLIGKPLKICEDDENVSEITVVDAIKNHEEDKN